MTSNPVFTERNIQKANACLLYSHPKQNLPSLYVCVWLVNTLTSTAPIGSPIICMWSLADICEQWERNLSFSSADVRGAVMRDEPLRTSAWEATPNANKQCVLVYKQEDILQWTSILHPVQGREATSISFLCLGLWLVCTFTYNVPTYLPIDQVWGHDDWVLAKFFFFHF